MEMGVVTKKRIGITICRLGQKDEPEVAYVLSKKLKGWRSAQCPL